jgi:AcrR family transcriptional regulator
MSPSDPVHLAGVTSPEPRARAQWGSLSREQIVAAAIATIEMGHYESMTIRSLASELGVAPMTLYRHIRDRDDLLDEVANQLLEKSWRPTEVHETWQEWISEAAMRLRNLLVARPAVLHVYLSHPVATPAAVERMESMLKVLRAAGLDEHSAGALYATLHTYTIGFAALEASRSAWKSTNDTDNALLKQLSEFTTTNQFVAGLDLLLRGVDARTPNE